MELIPDARGKIFVFTAIQNRKSIKKKLEIPGKYMTLALDQIPRISVNTNRIGNSETISFEHMNLH